MLDFINFLWLSGGFEVPLIIILAHKWLIKWANDTISKQKTF